MKVPTSDVKDVISWTLINSVLSACAYCAKLNQCLCIEGWSNVEARYNPKGVCLQNFIQTHKTSNSSIKLSQLPTIIIIYLFIRTLFQPNFGRHHDKLSNENDFEHFWQTPTTMIVWIKSNDRSNSWKVEAFSEMKKYYSYTMKKRREIVKKNSLLLVPVHCTIIVWRESF